MTLNRATWGTGPWDNEPDKVNWTTASGLPGMIVRNRGGALCGYVAVAPGHPLYRVEYNEGVEDGLAVHGGITYSSECAGDICHVPEPGKPDDVWWFGFDCAHAGDYIPGMGQALRGAGMGQASRGETYRDVAYVRAEVEALATQIAALGSAL